MPDLERPTINEGSGFSNLSEFTDRFSPFLERTFQDLSRVRGLNPELEGTIVQVVNERTISSYRDQIIGAIPVLTDDQASLLIAHGLDDGSADMNFKMATFNAAIENSPYREYARDGGGSEYRLDREPVTEAGLMKVLRSLGSVFTVANGILKSASHAIPVAGAYGELKDGAEAAIDLAGSTGGFLRKVYRRFRPAKNIKTPEPVVAREQ